MENLLLYIVKASALLAVFFLAYQLLLKKETFFSANRLFLLAGLITSALLPLAEFTKIILVEPQPQRALSMQEIEMLNTAIEQTVAQPTFEINWLYVILSLYAIGLTFFGVRLLLDIFKIRKMLTGKSVLKQKSFKLVDSPEIELPFSFFNYIVYNSQVLQPQELESILTHEKVHSRQKHSLDMLLTQAFCILFWFNPIVWLYKKAISQNLEFIADAEATKQIADVKAYQKTMLRLSVQPQHISITNHFYQSLIKKRIVMLNKQKSRRRNSWKYAVVLPALAAFMMAFQVKVVAQEKEPVAKNSITQNLKLALEVTKDSKDQELQAEKDVFKQEFDADVTISNVTRNPKSEITGIKVAIKAKGQDKVYEVSGTEPIADFTIEAAKDDAGIITFSFGNGGIKKPLRQRYATQNVVVEADSVYMSHTTTSQKASPQNGGAVKIINSSTEVNMGDKMLVVFNGRKMAKGVSIKIPEGEEIDEMTVLEKKEAKKKYGKEAKDGAVEILTRKKNVSNHSSVLPKTHAFAFTEPGIASPPIRQRVVIGSYINDDVKVYEELTDDQYLTIKDSDEAYSDLTLEEFKKQLAENKSAGVFTTTNASGYDNRPELMKEQLHAAQMRENSYKLKFFTEKMKQEMYEARQDMEKARKEMEKVRREMEAQRAKYKAEKKASKKS